jgi:hypothetical protein
MGSLILSPMPIRYTVESMLILSPANPQLSSRAVYQRCRPNMTWADAMKIRCHELTYLDQRGENPTMRIMRF